MGKSHIVLWMFAVLAAVILLIACSKPGNAPPGVELSTDFSAAFKPLLAPLTATSFDQTIKDLCAIPSRITGRPAAIWPETISSAGFRDSDGMFPPWPMRRWGPPPTTLSPNGRDPTRTAGPSSCPPIRLLGRREYRRRRQRFGYGRASRDRARHLARLRAVSSYHPIDRVLW